MGLFSKIGKNIKKVGSKISRAYKKHVRPVVAPVLMSGLGGAGVPLPIASALAGAIGPGGGDWTDRALLGGIQGFQGSLPSGGAPVPFTGTGGKMDLSKLWSGLGDVATGLVGSIADAGAKRLISEIEPRIGVPIVYDSGHTSVAPSQSAPVAAVASGQALTDPYAGPNWGEIGLVVALVAGGLVAAVVVARAGAGG